MTSMSKIVFFIFFIFSSEGIGAQASVFENLNVYDSDPVLYNGKVYTFFTSPQTRGHQFFSDPEFIYGDVTIRKTHYSDLIINYDIYNQQLILKYTSNLGAVRIIIVSDAWLEAFSFNNINFWIADPGNQQKKIYQVLGKGPYHILYHWKKDLELDNFHGAKNFVFSKPQREMNLLVEDDIFKYWNNKSFYSLFDQGKSDLIKEFLKRQKINVKKADDMSITKLIDFCNSL
jgi:hypothetical protein